VAWQWLISGFGEVRPTTGDRGYGQTVSGPNYVQAVKFDLRYPGQVVDEETGLSYNLHRYYDAATGRYIQADPIGLAGGWNRFGYVGGDPLGYADDEGLQRRSAAPPVSYAQSLINAQGISLTGQILRYQPNYSYSYASVPGYGFTPGNIAHLQGVLQRLQLAGTCSSASSPFAGGGASTPNISSQETLRIQNAVNRVRVPVAVVGSRARGSAGPLSDWDYVVPVGTSRRVIHSVSGSLPEGPRGLGEPRNQDFHRSNVDESLPYILFIPN
jgi:RHS repeat-associated protein